MTIVRVGRFTIIMFSTSIISLHAYLLGSIKSPNDVCDCVHVRYFTQTVRYRIIIVHNIG